MTHPEKPAHADDTTTPARAVRQPGSMSKSMHAGIAVWCDCCSCEMEPYWADVAREMGVEFSDYED